MRVRCRRCRAFSTDVYVLFSKNARRKSFSTIDKYNKIWYTLRSATDCTKESDDLFMDKNYTIYDLAAELGVTPSMVSRAFNPSARVAHEKREMILAAAKKRGFRCDESLEHSYPITQDVRCFLCPNERRQCHIFRCGVSQNISGQLGRIERS